jgi:hypothetical protein
MPPSGMWCWVVQCFILLTYSFIFLFPYSVTPCTLVCLQLRPRCLFPINTNHFPPCDYLFYNEGRGSMFLKILVPIHRTTQHHIPQGSNNNFHSQCPVSWTLTTYQRTGSLLYQTVKIFTDMQIYLLTIKNDGNSNWSEHLYLLQSHSVKTYFKTPPQWINENHEVGQTCKICCQH